MEEENEYDDDRGIDLFVVHGIKHLLFFVVKSTRYHGTRIIDFVEFYSTFSSQFRHFVRRNNLYSTEVVVRMQLNSNSN